jgi:hypothetical protein
VDEKYIAYTRKDLVHNKVLQTRDIKIGNQYFRIPMFYLGTELSPSLEQDNVLLVFYWPDFIPPTGIPEYATNSAVDGNEKFGQIYLSAGVNRTPFTELRNKRRRSVQKYEVLEDKYNLRREAQYRNWYSAEIPYYDMYYELNDIGDVVGYIECSTIQPNTKRYPNCKDHIVYEGLFYNITYNKKAYLPAWQKMRSNAIDFVQSMKISKEDMGRK